MFVGNTDGYGRLKASNNSNYPDYFEDGSVCRIEAICLGFDLPFLFAFFFFGTDELLIGMTKATWFTLCY